MTDYDSRTGCSYSCPFYDRQPDDTHQDVCLAEECTGQRKPAEPVYGQRVMVSAKMERRHKGEDADHHHIRGWVSVPLMSADRLLAKPIGAEPYEGTWGRVEVVKEGIFLGYRTLTEGYNFGGGGSWSEYEPPTYCVTNRIKVAFVSLGAHTNPVHVPLDALTLATEVPQTCTPEKGNEL